MPDANQARQRRHDLCKRLCECPKCGAPAGEPCQSAAVQKMRHHVWLAGQQMGKTMMSTTIAANALASLAAGDVKAYIGGLHRERWQAFERLDAVTRLGLVVDGQT